MNKNKVILSLLFIIPGAVGLILLFFDVFSFPFAGWVYPILIVIGGSIINTAEKEKEAKSVANKERSLSEDEKKKIARLKNMLYLAYADGEFKKEEAYVCLTVAVSSGLDKELAAKVCDSFEYQSWEVYIPENQEDLNTHVNELFAVMMMDGRSNKKERERLKELLIKFGVNESTAENYIEQGVENLKASEDFQNLRKRIKSM